jgi:hypothetical protein
MARIKPNLTITANSSSASTNAGPLSVALSLSATAADAANGGNLLVDNVSSAIFTVPTATGASVRLLDGSTYIGTGTAGTDGSFLYLRNTATAEASNDIYVAFLDEQSPDNGAGPDLDAAGTGSTRTFTLKAGEFAFLPWDYTGDVFVQAEAADQTIEYWLFDRSTT